jgi:hypothetical protein
MEYRVLRRSSCNCQKLNYLLKVSLVAAGAAQTSWARALRTGYTAASEVKIWHALILSVMIVGMSFGRTRPWSARVIMCVESAAVEKELMLNICQMMLEHRNACLILPTDMTWVAQRHHIQPLALLRLPTARRSRDMQDARSCGEALRAAAGACANGPL